jgi:hypothetical protein
LPSSRNLRVRPSASAVLPDSTAWQSALNDIITPPYYLRIQWPAFQFASSILTNPFYAIGLEVAHNLKRMALNHSYRKLFDL